MLAHNYSCTLKNQIISHSTTFRVRIPTVAHVGSTTTVHVATLYFLCTEPKVSEFDDNTALLAGS